MKPTITVLISVVLCGCFQTPDKKLYIKSIQVDDAIRVDWYFFSKIGGFSQSYLQYEDKVSGQQTFFESFYLSEVIKRGGTLIVQLWNNDYELNNAKSTALGVIIIIDTTGAHWNDAASRLGRLKRKNVDVKNYHFADSYCPKGECY